MSKNAEIIGSIIEFFSMLSGGFFIALFFDVFRSMRKAVRKNNGKNFIGIVYLQDLLFLLVSFVLLVLLIYRVNGGKLDWYISFGCVAGAVVYYYLAEPVAGKIIFAVFFIIIKIFKVIALFIKKIVSKVHFCSIRSKFLKKGIFFAKKRKKLLKKAGETEIHNI